MFRGRRMSLAVALFSVGCQFNQTGLPAGGQSGDAGGVAPGAPDAAGVVDGPPSIDATPLPCLDQDMDGFMIVNIEGATCGQPLDCDDDEPNAFPGQADFFDVPRASGGFDYDCNGIEEPENTTQGGSCESDWWECVGTGWNGDVPACGVTGVYHTCEDINGCTETSSFDAKMPCR